MLRGQPGPGRPRHHAATGVHGRHEAAGPGGGPHGDGGNGPSGGLSLAEIPTLATEHERDPVPVAYAPSEDFVIRSLR